MNGICGKYVILGMITFICQASPVSGIGFYMMFQLYNTLFDVPTYEKAEIVSSNP